MSKYDGPVVLVVLDGVGINTESKGNAVKAANTPFLSNAASKYLNIPLQASGEAVGILPGVMGNSEVGHNAIGSGQIIEQGITKIDSAFKTGKIWNSTAWQGAISNIKANNSTLHFSGIFSDGKVHSDIEHLFAMIIRAVEEGITKVRLHPVFDGRDVPPQSAEKYLKMFAEFKTKLPANVSCEIASGGGRMVFTADRYENDWQVVKAGWDAYVYGVAPDYFETPEQALEYFRGQDKDIQDQFLPPFVIKKDGQPVGKVEDGDSFIYFDFRADRAIEIAQAFTYEDFPYFDRGTKYNARLNVYFAGLTEYNSDTHVPEHQLVPPVVIENTLSDFLAGKEVTQFAVSETVKFGHITYYFNGNSYDQHFGEDFYEIPSDTLPFEERPWMKSAETADKVIEKIHDYQFIRLNLAGGDMVGHTGDFEATKIAMEAIDLALSRIAKKVDELGGMMLITADHGNAEELLNDDGTQKTAHSLNLVPAIFYDNTDHKYQSAEINDAGLSNIAATIANLLGYDDVPTEWRSSLIKMI